MQKKIKFLLTRMNFLYSFIPLAKMLSQNHDVEIIIPLRLVRNDKKPNSLVWGHNVKEALDICHNHGIYCDYYDLELSEFKTDILFTIEGHGLQDTEKLDYEVISIQNFNDFTTRIINKDSKHIYEKIDTMWVCDGRYEKLASKLGFDGEFFVDMLPGYWQYKDISKQYVKKQLKLEEHKKIAICYLPRSSTVYQKETHLRTIDWNTGDPKSDLNHAVMFAERLTKEGYKVFFKQRLKNRNPELEHLTNYIEDVSIMPYTSMDMAYISDLSYGYVSAAIMDCATLQTPYINFEKTQYPPETMSLYTQHYLGNTIIGVDINTPINDIVLPVKREQDDLMESIMSSRNNFNDFIWNKDRRAPLF